MASALSDAEVGAAAGGRVSEGRAGEKGTGATSTSGGPDEVPDAFDAEADFPGDDLEKSFDMDDPEVWAQLERWDQEVQLSSEHEALLEEIKALVDSVPMTEWANVREVPEEMKGAPPMDRDAVQRELARVVGEPVESRGADAEEGAVQPTASSSKDVGDVELRSTHDFLEWYEELEAVSHQETWEKYDAYVAELEACIEGMASMEGQVRQILGLLEEIRADHATSSAKTGLFMGACEGLMQEIVNLKSFEGGLSERLQFFESLDAASAAINGAGLSCDDDAFPAMLAAMDDSIANIEQRMHYKEAEAYLVRFRQLQARGFAVVRAYAQKTLGEAAEAARPAAPQGPQEPVAGTSGASAGVLENDDGDGALAAHRERFRTALKGLHSLLRQLANQGGDKPEYRQLLEDCIWMYAEHRMALLSPALQRRIEACSQSVPLEFVRTGACLLLGICADEYDLAENFFPSAQAGGDKGGAGSGEQPRGAGFDWAGVFKKALCEPLCGVLSDRLRPMVMNVSDVGELCALVDLMQNEILVREMGRRGASAEPARDALTVLLNDIRQRVIFRALAFVRERVEGFKPSSEVAEAAAFFSKCTAFVDQAGGGGEPPERLPECSLLETSVTVLQQLYAAVEPSVFSAIAHETIRQTSLGLQRTSAAIEKAVGPAARLADSACTADLYAGFYLLAHLVSLRDKLRPFSVELGFTDKHLDFSNTREYIGRVYSSPGSLVSMRDNSLLGLVSNLRSWSPKVQQVRGDSRKELEGMLSSQRDKVVKRVIADTCDALSNFLLKVDAFRASGKSDLGSSAFGSPERVKELISKVNTALSKTFPQVARVMLFHLRDPAARADVSTPIRTGLLQHYSKLDALLDAEYTAEQRETFGAVAASKVSDDLDAMFA